MMMIMRNRKTLLHLLLVGVSILCQTTFGQNNSSSSSNNSSVNVTTGPSEQPSSEQSLFLLSGILLNDLNEPVDGAQIQLWQTDVNGNYAHPGNQYNGYQLVDFGYFGTALTDVDGSFNFLTYRPGIYASRPITHFHFKVWYEGDVLLTSQFYFADENLQFFDDMITLDVLTDIMSGIQYTNKTLFVDMGLGGNITKFTPSQQEGPFYPLIDFFDASNDLTIPKSFNYTFGVSPTAAATAAPLIPDDNNSTTDTMFTNGVQSGGNNNKQNGSSAASVVSSWIGIITQCLVGMVLILQE